MKSGVNYETNKEGKRVPVSAWCEIWRNDMTHSFQTEVPFSDYSHRISRVEIPPFRDDFKSE